MAGAGYKLFNTGDVLTAAQVNTYLMEQSVMVFANAAARTTALSGVVAEGMLSYLKDTDAVEVYNGSAWVSSDDPNAIQNTIVDAKGDLISASAADVPARLAVGNNGETLLADSAATTGLRWGANYGFTAGKNKIINGDFAINQRGFTSETLTGAYGFDRWSSAFNDGTSTWTPQTFTAGAAPVAGYEAINFSRLVSSGQTATTSLTAIAQKIEDVRTFAGQTITVSFWAKASTGTPNIVAYAQQNFGSGGSSAVNVAPTTSKQAISTSWARYSFIISIPSISGKTLGAGNHLFILLTQSAGTARASYTDSIGIQSVTIDYWGVQVEAGSVATAFQTATGTLAGELAACMRYYQRVSSDSNQVLVNYAFASSSTLAIGQFQFIVPMRTVPTSLDSSNVKFRNHAGAGFTMSSIAFNEASAYAAQVYGTISGGTAEQPGSLLASATTGYIGLSAEL